MTAGHPDAPLGLGERLTREVLEPMKALFVDKDEVIDLLGVCLAGGENLFICGPPGTAKSALVHELGLRLDGRTFEYLLTRFTEPSEIFGPFDIRRLREGDLVTNTEGMLPEAEFVFLDELLNANSAILNSLLTALNERVFRRGRETRRLPMLMAVGASNRLPEDDSLCALLDRFLLRVRCDNVPSEKLGQVVEAGWRLDLGLSERGPGLRVEEVRALQASLPRVDLGPVRPLFIELVHRLRHAAIPISDRRAVKLQRLIAGSALLCGRREAAVSDLWVLRHTWDTEEQVEVIAALVKSVLDTAPADPAAHPRSRGPSAPDPEVLARDLESIERKASEVHGKPSERAYLRDRLGILEGRAEWVADAGKRGVLKGRIQAIWRMLE